MTSEVDVHCILIIADEHKGVKCEHCEKLLNHPLFKRFRWFKPMIPIVPISLARKFYPDLFRKAQRIEIDEWGNIRHTLPIPVLVCRELDEPIIMSFASDEELYTKLEIIRTLLSTLEQRVGKQRYRAIATSRTEQPEREVRIPRVARRVSGGR